MATITLRPTSGSGTSWTNIANAYDTDATTSATVNVSTNNYSSRTATFYFDTSQIPSNATINSATLTIRCMGGSTRLTLYADINGSSSNRVINSACSTTLGNKIVNITSYMSNLNSIMLTGYNSSFSTYTLSIYDISIAVDYEATTTYTVTFKDWDGTVLKTQTVNHGSSATPPSNPSRTGYTFTGWSGSYTNITSNVTITAQYSIKTYTVTFKDWDNTTLKTQTVNHGSSATPPSNPSRTGYTFSGWSGSYTNITSNLTITAQYTIKTYTVTFKDWNGTTLKTQTVNHGSSATPPSNPTRDGYEFTGWDRAFTNVTSNLTVTAQYTYVNSNKLYIGELIIDKLYTGDSQVNKVYMGETLLYSISSSPSLGYVTVSASTNLSDVDLETTAIAIELTSNNYKTRIDEVLPYFPNCTDLYFFDDGSVYSLFEMMYGSNNATYKTQIVNVTFMDGYFNNLTNMEATFIDCTSLSAVSAIPNSVTSMFYTFQNCTSLTTVSAIPNSATNMEGTFYYCTALTTAPVIPNNVTNMKYAFGSCTALTTAPVIPNSVTNMFGTFYNCTALTTAPTIPNNVTDMNTAFYNCTSLTTGAKISSTSITDITALYYGCTKLQSCDIPLSATNYSNALRNVPSTCNVTWLGERTTSFDVYYSLYYRSANQTDIRELVTEHLADLTGSLTNKLTIVNRKGTLNDTYSATTDYAVGNFIIGSFYYDTTSDYMPGTCRMYKAILNGVEIIPIIDTWGFPSFLNTQTGSIYYNQYSGGNLVAGNVIGIYGDYQKLDYIMATNAVVRASDVSVSSTSHNLEYHMTSANSHDTNTHIVNQMAFSSSKTDSSVFNHTMSAWYGNAFVDSYGNAGQTKSSASQNLTLGSTYLGYLTEEEKLQATNKGWKLQ